MHQDGRHGVVSHPFVSCPLLLFSAHPRHIHIGVLLSIYKALHSCQHLSPPQHVSPAEVHPSSTHSFSVGGMSRTETEFMGIHVPGLQKGYEILTNESKFA